VFSFTDEQKVALLYGCRCLVYTPSNEHFGIVPLEAMYCGKPVIAVNSGGPLESVKHEETGFLCESNASAFANAIRWVNSHPQECAQMVCMPH
jgi:alpha-1,3/alpha-1,6-mannosyltransferase